MKEHTLEKIVVNMGIGKHREDAKYRESAAEELAVITGQRPAERLAKKAVAGFKVQAGEPVGLIVTLRGKKMWAFFEKLVNIVLPRLRDFRGVSRKSFDGSGNYSLGIEEHAVFPEIDPNKVTRAKGLEVTVVTSAKTDEEALELLEKLGVPFADAQGKPEQ